MISRSRNSTGIIAPGYSTEALQLLQTKFDDQYPILRVHLNILISLYTFFFNLNTYSNPNFILFYLILD